MTEVTSISRILERKTYNNNRFYRKQSCIYVSKSKNGKQYLDSLGGDCDKGGYYVSGNFYFVS